MPRVEPAGVIWMPPGPPFFGPLEGLYLAPSDLGMHWDATGQAEMNCFREGWIDGWIVTSLHVLSG